MDSDMLKGIGSELPSAIRPSTPRKREKSIELEDQFQNAQEEVTRRSKQICMARDLTSRLFNPEKPPLLPLDCEVSSPKRYREKTPVMDGPPLVPSNPSTPSTDSITHPLEVYLNTQDKHEDLKMNLSAPSLDQEAASARAPPAPRENDPSPETLCGSTWQLIDKSENEPSVSWPVSAEQSTDKDNNISPPSPVLQPLTSPRASGHAIFEASSTLSAIAPDLNPSPEANVPGSPDSAISVLDLSPALQPRRVRSYSQASLDDEIRNIKKLVVRSKSRITKSTTLKAIKRRVRSRDSREKSPSQ